MNRIAQEYINKQKEIAERKKLEKRKDFLEEIELYERIYSDNTKYTDEYPVKDTNEDSEHYGKFYKEIPIELTDEEYEEVLNAYKLNHGKVSSDDTVAMLLFSISVFIYIVGGLLALISFGAGAITGISTLAAVFVGGTSFLGFSRIIALLNDIKNK